MIPALPGALALKHLPHAAEMGTTLHMSDKIQPSRPSADDEMNNATAGDSAMQDELTQERQVTPQTKEDVAQTQHMDS